MLMILTTSRAIGYEPPIKELISKSRFLDPDDKEVKHVNLGGGGSTNMLNFGQIMV
jgi:hypothetical protein